MARTANIKIGAPLGLTGAVSDEAKKQEVTFKMWLNKVNAAGGINVGGTKMKVQLDQYDISRPSAPRSFAEADHRR